MSGIEQQVFIDIDSPRPRGAPVIAGIRLRGGKAASGRGAASMIAEAIGTARACGAIGDILVRGDSAYGNSARGQRLCQSRGGFSVVLTKNRAVTRAIATISTFTAFASTNHPITARLIVRRVRDQTKSLGRRLRAGRAGSGKGAASMVREAIRTARACGATGKILVRGDSAYGNSLVVNACVTAGAEFSMVLIKNPAVTRAIAAIPADAWVAVQYPGAVEDPDPHRQAAARGATLRRRIVHVPARLDRRTRPNRRTPRGKAGQTSNPVTPETTQTPTKSP